MKTVKFFDIVKESRRIGVTRDSNSFTKFVFSHFKPDTIVTAPLSQAWLLQAANREPYCLKKITAVKSATEYTFRTLN